MSGDHDINPWLDVELRKWADWWKAWRKEHGRPFATTFTSATPDAQEHPELNLLARDCFGFDLDARYPTDPSNPTNNLESVLHLARRPGATATEFEGDDPGIVAVSALRWSAAPAMQVLRLVHVYATRDPGEQHWRLAEAVIRVAEDGREATDTERKALGEAMHEAARELAKRLGWDADGLRGLPWWDMPSVAKAQGFTYANPDDPHEAIAVRWMYGRQVDAETLGLAGSYGKVADLLEGLGKAGKKWVRGLTSHKTAMWARPEGPTACPGGPTRSPVFWALTDALWRDKVGPYLRNKAKKEAEIEQRQRRAALLPKTHSQLGNVFVSARFEGENIVSDAGQLPLVVVSSIPSAALGVLASATAQRAFRWIVRTASVGDIHEPYVRIPGANGVTVTRLERGVEVVIDGGFQGWSDVLGLKSKKGETDLKDTLDVLSGVHLREMLPGHRGGGTLINWSERGDAARGGGRRRLVFSVHPILCPGVAKIALESGEDATLVHVLPFPSIPDDFERGPTAAALGRLDWLAAQLFARHRRSAAKEGSLVIDWRDLGKKAGATPRAVDAALALWCNGPKRRWDALAGERFMYAADGEPEAAAAREFILQGAALSERRAAQGRKGGQSQRRKKRRSPP